MEDDLGLAFHLEVGLGLDDEVLLEDGLFVRSVLVDDRELAVDLHGRSKLDHVGVEGRDLLPALLEHERRGRGSVLGRAARDLERVGVARDFFHAIALPLGDLRGENELGLVVFGRNEGLLPCPEVARDEVVPANDGVAVHIGGPVVLDRVVDSVPGETVGGHDGWRSCGVEKVLGKTLSRLALQCTST